MTTTIGTTQLPATVRTFLTAHAARETEAATRAFAPDAVVTDEGRTYRGTQEVRDFLDHAGSELTYTSELVGAEHVDDARWVAVVRLQGDFPGGLAELRYRFRLRDDLVEELVIAP